MMELRPIFMWVATVALLGYLVVVPSQAAGSPALTLGGDCSSTMSSLSPCVPFLIKEKVSLVTTDCCKSFVSELEKNSGCLWELAMERNSFDSVSRGVSELPQICNVTNVISNSCSGCDSARRFLRNLVPATVILVPTPDAAPSNPQSAGVRESFKTSNLLALVALASILPILCGI